MVVVVAVAGDVDDVAVVVVVVVAVGDVLDAKEMLVGLSRAAQTLRE